MAREVKIDFPEYDKTLTCVHCGLCLPFCPTYRVLGVEPDSPRGRIHLIRAFAEGRISITEEFEAHIDLCLLCRNCETVCPSGVQFASIMEAARAEAGRSYPRSASQRLINRLVYEQLFPHPVRLSLAFALLRYYQKSGLQWLARRLGLMSALPGRPDRFEAMLPKVPERFFRPPKGGVIRALGGRRHRVGLLSGCVMGTLFSPIDEATVNILALNGCEVVIPKGQRCCGALNAHSGAMDTALEMARRNIDAFLAADVDEIIVNSAGCGATMKDYGELLRHDPEYAEKASTFSSKVRDISEFLASIELSNQFGEVKMRATFQDPCHLAHGQRIRAQPRALINLIPGVELVEMKDSDTCCGSAGNYFVTHHEVSMKLLDEKVASIRATGADTIITANPPCLVQLNYGLKRAGYEAKVMHIVELLHLAYRLGGAYGKLTSMAKGYEGQPSAA